MGEISVGGVTWIILCASLGASAATVSGTVVDATGAPLAGARVFLERDLTSDLAATVSASDGSWRFDDVPGGTLGVFAVKDGCALGGETVRAASGETVSGIVIRLGTPDIICGRVTRAHGKPIAGASVARVALLGAAKVGIPLGKLQSFGLSTPSSDDKGRFEIGQLPKGGLVALKVSHPDYAQTGLTDVAVGSENVTVELYEGLVVEGEVLTREGRLPVQGAQVVIRNAAPPYDTVTAQTMQDGRFAIRLNAGSYACQAVSRTVRSPGWTQFALTGKESLPRFTLVVAGTGRVVGKVCNAKTDGPVAGAKIVLETEGNAAAVERTGPDGTFSLAAMAGENVVRLDSAPGYAAPEQPALKVTVMEERQTPLPTFWLVPLPTFPVKVVDAAMQPVSGVVVGVLWPEQFGWQMTDGNGSVTLRFGSLPPDGTVIGLVEHIAKPEGALFGFKAGETQDATVQLFSLGTVMGRVVTTDGKPVAGAVVGALYGDSELPLWRTVSGPDGAFAWRSVVPKVRQRCVAYVGEQPSGESIPFDVEPGATLDIGNVVSPSGATASSMLGKPLAWYEHETSSGTLPDKKTCRNSPAVVVYCEPEEAAMAAEGLAAAREIAGRPEVLYAIVTTGAYAGRAVAGVPILSGKAPAAATTYIVNAKGEVAVETFGMPPVRALREIE